MVMYRIIKSGFTVHLLISCVFWIKKTLYIKEIVCNFLNVGYYVNYLFSLNRNIKIVYR